MAVRVHPAGQYEASGGVDLGDAGRLCGTVRARFHHPQDLSAADQDVRGALPVGVDHGAASNDEVDRFGRGHGEPPVRGMGVRAWRGRCASRRER
ncbi:hypothetical protein SVIO_002330 [Streptomyces violaceusniger]|uniref:Uncharacterized protein n=1 Tax=Streptomyces violaceusniger TaxID=68280 RepID=A0A4D4KSQ6_STRVO|nr:hypothetical protein SVIO_002330 [Streptomyces violaceusniger]